MIRYLLAIAILSGGWVLNAQSFKQVTLSNGELELLVLPPDPVNGYYRDNRFDASGIIAQAAYRGHTYFQGTEKTTGSRGTGTIEEFRIPLDYDESSAGKPFLKVGVGVLRSNGKPYRFGGDYEIVQRGEWKTTQGDRWIAFEQDLRTDIGYAYTYRKKITLSADSPEFTIDHEFTNTGSKRIVTDNYCHNYTRFDERPVSPDYSTTFHGGLKTPDGPGDFYRIDGDTIRPPHELVDGETSGIALATSYDMTVANRATGTALHITGDHPVSSLWFFCWRWAMCPEPYIEIDLAPKEKIEWQTGYKLTAP